MFQQKSTLYYCYKGLIRRITPITVHLIMILIFSGTDIGALNGL